MIHAFLHQLGGRCALTALFLCLAGLAYAQRPMLGDGLPPFLRNMEKHEVMVTLSLRAGEGEAKVAPEGTRVRFQITSAGTSRMKIKEYEGRTD
ncbi:MAG: hypothetical protein VYD19_10810, partial [Myxococcota bacterium]|nr:hypothetical protein [Myxococcota bacterium]